MMKRRLLTLCLVCAAFLLGMVATAQTIEQPLVMLAANDEDGLHGDLWAWTWGDDAPRRLTRWGFNERPVISPDAERVAYNSWSQLVVIAHDPAVPLLDAPPSNTWIYDLTTGRSERLNGQPAGASYLKDGYTVHGIARSTPSWSPDGRAVAWGELVYPTYTFRLAIYEFSRDDSEIIVPAMPAPYLDMGASPYEVEWGAGGIATATLRVNENTGEPESAVLVYDIMGNMVSDTVVTGGENSIADLLWVGESIVVSLYPSGQWVRLDPTGALELLAAPPQRVSPEAGETAVYASMAVGGGLEYDWYAALREEHVPLSYTGESAGIALAPGGEAVAYAEDGIVTVWQGGDTMRVPETGERLFVSALVWGAPAHVVDAAATFTAGVAAN
jgi:hypothetical protein